LEQDYGVVLGHADEEIDATAADPKTAELLQVPRGVPLLRIRQIMNSEIRWAAPTYTGIHSLLTNPVYAGAYTHGKVRHERYMDAHGSTCRDPVRNSQGTENLVLTLTLRHQASSGCSLCVPNAAQFPFWKTFSRLACLALQNTPWFVSSCEHGKETHQVAGLSLGKKRTS
jgi:hypothetical protein